MIESIYSLTKSDIINICDQNKLSPKMVDKFYGQVYRKSFKDINSEVSSKLINYLEDHYTHNLPKIIKLQKSIDGTIKFLIEFEDKSSVESVLLPYWKKYGLCVSSQVGCAMNCSFCHTATQGLKRNLTASEIVMQVMVAKKYLKDNNIDLPLTNVVFMGQGEPLHNFENVSKAISILSDPHGLSIGKNSITVSTSGFLPGLKRFSELGVNLALSLHSVKENVRNELIPINRAYPLEKVLEQIDELDLKKRQKVEYEYLLIKDLNNTHEDIELITSYLQNREHLLNIIPFNPFPNSKYKRPNESEIDDFKQKLVANGIRVMVRQTKGDDILAACGQLKS